MVTEGRAGGGWWIITPPQPSQVLTPEQLTDEHRLIARTVRAFLAQEVAPLDARLEAKDLALMREVLTRLGALGVFAAEVPPEYGGLGPDPVTGVLLAETISRGSLSSSVGAHVTIGMLPIVFFGAHSQRTRYLPRMVTGELIGAYALTEATAGSDALSLRTSAVQDPDGSYRLTGSKQFITNGGIADVYILYAKVDGKLTCFIVDRATPGFTVGPEEHKLGLRGSSTTSLFLDNVRVPRENVIGEPGRGHVIALNILNVGRLKLGAGCVGAAKHALREAVAYARERRQFGRPIASFGLIRQKVARMAIRLYLAESMVYRTAGLLDRALRGLDLTGDRGGSDAARAIEEYAPECAINKVYGSEMLDFVVDEMVQIYGGYGFIEDYPAARAYRDARINRLYEGTNEINRLVIAGQVLRRAARGRLPLRDAAKAAAEGLGRAGGGSDAPASDRLARVRRRRPDGRSRPGGGRGDGGTPADPRDRGADRGRGRPAAGAGPGRHRWPSRGDTLEHAGPPALDRGPRAGGRRVPAGAARGLTMSGGRLRAGVLSRPLIGYTLIALGLGRCAGPKSHGRRMSAIPGEEVP